MISNKVLAFAISFGNLENKILSTHFPILLIKSFQVLFPTFKVLLDKIKSGNKEIRISIFSPFVCPLDSIPPHFLDNHFIINLSPLFITVFIFIACRIYVWAFEGALAPNKSIFFNLTLIWMEDLSLFDPIHYYSKADICNEMLEMFLKRIKSEEFSCLWLLKIQL